jgi:hypothetical protein
MIKNGRGKRREVEVGVERVCNDSERGVYIWSLRECRKGEK